MIEICYDNNGASIGGIMQTRHTQTIVGTNVYAVCYGNPGISACSMQPNDLANPTTWQVSQYRPNITFKYHRPFVRYEIESRKHWVNNGTYIPGFSKVAMTGANSAGVNGMYAQNVSGSSPTTFYDLEINNTQHVTRKTDFTVTDSLVLRSGWLKLDSGTVTLNKPDTGARTRVNGDLMSENAPAGGMYYGNLRWNMSGAVLPQNYTLPFVNSGGNPVMLNYKAEAGNHDVTFATYGTGPANTPLPQESGIYPAPVVNNINSFNVGTNNSINMVDRYWKIYNATPSAAQADITLRYAVSEQALGGNSNMVSQRWVANAGSFTPGPGWELPLWTGQTFTPNAITVPDFTAYADNIWWTAVREEIPLPVELLDFTARPYKERVKINWTTASELNNDKFVVERTVNMNDWSFIGELKSRGNSVVMQVYELWDNEPFNGMQYYTLLQTDLGGKTKKYGPVAVDMSKKQFGIVSASVKAGENKITLIFHYDSSEPYSVVVTDVAGRVVAAVSDNPENTGLNVMEINAEISSGVYTVTLRNSKQSDTLKLVY
jgi:hypothetical protein